jgi:hypothetical protein
MNYDAHTGHALQPSLASAHGHPAPSQALTPSPLAYRGPEDSLAPMSLADRTLHSTRIPVPVETERVRSVRSAVFMVSGFLIGVAVCVLVMRQAVAPQELSGGTKLAAAAPPAAEGLPPPKVAPGPVPSVRDVALELPEGSAEAAIAKPKPVSNAKPPRASASGTKAQGAPKQAAAAKAPLAGKRGAGTATTEEELMRQAFAATASAL